MKFSLRSSPLPLLAVVAFTAAVFLPKSSAQSSIARPPASTPSTGAPTTPTTALTDSPTRLTNLSVRARAGTEGQTLTIGFTVSGTPDKPTLLRVIGPSLAQFGITDALADPSLILLAGNTVLRANDNWAVGLGNGDSLIEEHTRAFAQVGAFPLDPAAQDSAFIRSMAARGYTAQVGGATTPGTALFELYDLFPEAGARLSNLSARAQVTPGAALIAGFVVSGEAPKQFLLRAIGPGLTALGVSGVLTNPKLELYRGATLVQANDDWAGVPALVNAFTAAGAFALPDAASRDAALLVTLAPGIYSAVVSGSASESGIALVEIYEAP